jgi:spermidine synthase
VRILVDHDSLYHHIRVQESDDVRALKFDLGTQSAMRVSDPLAGVFAYTDALHLPMALRPGVRDVLLIGVGGATIPKQFLAAYPDVQMDAVEIDGDVIDVARNLFGLTDSPRLRIHVNDGRKFLAASKQKYDLIEIDAFHADSMPFHLFTREFFALCKQHLHAGGMVAINVIGSVEGEGSAVISSVYQTVGIVFPERYVFVMNSHLQPERAARHNVIIIAGDSAQMTEQELRNAVFAAKLAGPYARRVDDYANRPPDPRYGRVLSDDFAPTDDLLILSGGLAHFQSDSSSGARR